MSKFHTVFTQAKELCDEAKKAKEKNKELSNEVLLKKGEVIRLTEDLTRLEGKVLGLTSSLEKAREEAIVAFKKSDKYKNHLDSHYAAGYEDFRADAKEAYPNLDFDSFKIPLATKSSLLPTSSEDVNVVDDATMKVTLDATVASKDDPKSRDDASNDLSQ